MCGEFKMTTSSVSENPTRKAIENCLSEQLCEFELLKSMYPNQGSIVLTDKSILVNINDFLQNKTEFVPYHLDFTLNLDVTDCRLEVSINLPTHYPNDEPDIYLRCNQLNRQQETKLNADLTDYIKVNHVSEVCLYTIITWLQDNIDKYRDIPEKESKNKPLEELETVTQLNKYSRLWIYSHHIYNKKKREDIVKKAKELNLTGFYLPGKPGVICIEGEYNSCQDWWKDIKSMNWKRIMIKQMEIFDSVEFKKFLTFEELKLKNIVNNKHANMSEFSKYMHENGFSKIFNEIFGFSNQ